MLCFQNVSLIFSCIELISTMWQGGMQCKQIIFVRISPTQVKFEIVFEKFKTRFLQFACGKVHYNLQRTSIRRIIVNILFVCLHFLLYIDAWWLLSFLKEHLSTELSSWSHTDWSYPISWSFRIFRTESQCTACVTLQMYLEIVSVSLIFSSVLFDDVLQVRVQNHFPLDGSAQWLITWFDCSANSVFK